MNLKERLTTLNGDRPCQWELLNIPSTGRIDDDTVATINQLALAARKGDIEARDSLYFSLRPRLHRIGTVLRPWPNTSQQIGIWDRDDVQQESWIVFVELLETWDTSIRFVPYFLARFAWRLRDRILRGIGKSQHQLGFRRVPEEALKLVLFAGDEEQPESATIARKLLEHVLQQHFNGDAKSREIEAWLEVIQNQEQIARSSAEITSPGDTSENLRRVG